MRKVGVAVWAFLVAVGLGGEPLPADRCTVSVQGLYRIDAQGNGPASVALVGRAAGEVVRVGLSEDVKIWKGSAAFLLEPGDYQVRWAKEKGVDAGAQIQRFPLINAPSLDQAPALGDGDTVRASLADGQSLAWKVVVPPNRRRLNLELRGRNVSQVVLWKDGVWDQGVSFGSATVAAQTGRPYRYFELDRDLEPGSYVLVAWGAPRTAWADSMSGDPFMVSRGRQPLPLGGVREGKLDDEGRAEFWIQPGASLIQAEFPDAVDALLSVTGQRLIVGGRSLKAVDPVRLVQSGTNGSGWAVLQGAPGTRFRVRALVDRQETGYLPSSDRGVLLASAPSAQEADGFPLTALVVAPAAANTPPRVLVDRSLAVDDDHPLHLAFDTQSASTLYVRIAVPGAYTVFENADHPGAAEYRFDLLDDLLQRSGNRTPLVARAGATITLQAKIYRVSTTALKLGRCEWALPKAGLFAGLGASALWAKPVSALGPWTAVVPEFAPNAVPQLFVSRRGGAPSPLAVHRLPLGAASVPVLNLEPGQTVQFPVQFSSGIWGGWKGADVTVEGTAFAPGGATAESTVSVAITSARGGVFEALPGPPPPDAPPALPRRIPTGQTLWEDWSRDQTRVYELEVTAPGMYRWVTLGRLSCALRVRTPLHRELFSASKNGGGTNALLSTYLAPGLYRVEMRVLDGTFGRAGLTLTAAADAVERALVPGTQARATVPAQRFLKVDVNVASSGLYVLTSLGLNQDFTRRLEDADGYPVGSPLEQYSREIVLDQGRYTLWSYPLEADSRRAYGLEAVPEETDDAARPGVLVWNRGLQATWEESPERTPQTYMVTAEAPLRAQIVLSEGMVWQLLGSGGAVLDQGPGGSPAEVSIPAGSSRVAVRSQAVDNLKDYSLALLTLDLTPGRAIALPEGADVPLVVGHQGTFELMTWGSREVSLTLTNADGSVVFHGAPRTDDWNTGITAVLAPGRYVAQIRGPGSASGLEQAPTSNGSSNEEEPSYSDSDNGDYVENEDSGDEYSGEDGGEEPAYQQSEPEVPAWAPWREVRFPGDADAVPQLIFRERPSKTAASGGGPEVWGSAVVTRAFTTKAAGVYRFGSDAGQLAVFRLMRDGKVLAQAAGGILIPLPAQTAYQLSAWWEDGTTRPVTLSAGPAEAAVWSNPNGVSGRLPGIVSASAALEEPLAPAPDGWLAPRDTVWWTDGSGSKASPAPVAVASGDSISVPLERYGQAVRLTVPAGSVGLLRARGNGTAVGLSVQTAATADWNWRQAGFSDQESLVGVPAGDYTGRVWNPEGGSLRWADLTWTAYIASETAAGSGVLDPGDAVLVKNPAKNLRVTLDAGLIAFPLSGGRPLSAVSGPTTRTLAGGLAIVNPSGRRALWKVEAASAEGEPLVTEKTPWERVLPEPGDVTVNVQGGDGSRVYVSFGDADEVRWGDASTGRWETPAKTALPTGSWLEWPRSRGTLFLKGVSGWLRVIVAAAPPTTPASLGFSGNAAALPAEGGALTVSQQWTFRAAQPGFYAVSASGGGVLGVWQKGVPLSAAWSSDRRLLLVRLAAGDTVIAARPFEGAVSGGTVSVRPLAPQTDETLLAPGEAQLWPVTVKAAGRVGLAISSDSEEPRLWLFGKDFQPLGQGRLFWRNLEPGAYWLVVEGGGQTVRYKPVLLGLEGSRLGVPDDVQAGFRQDSSLSQGQSE